MHGYVNNPRRHSPFLLDLQVLKGVPYALLLMSDDVYCVQDTPLLSAV
jgi:hypothetical protein